MMGQASVQQGTLSPERKKTKLANMSAFASKSGRAVHPQSPPSGAPPGGNTELASLFECPVCFDYVLPPILQCQSGHLVCANCRPKLTCCPTCRGPLGNIRNLAMEKVASTVMFPCKYSSSGCSATLLHTDKTEHEDTCEFRPYMCPCPGASCKWQGSLEQVMPHLMSVHKSITTLQGEDIVFLATDINLPGAVDWVMIQSCFSHHFILVLGKQEKFDGHQQFFAIVQLIGFRKQAENFAYSSFSLHRAPPSSTREARVRKIPQDLFIDIVESLRQHRGQHRLPATSLGSRCSATLLHTDKTEHEDTCEFWPYMCPCPSASCKSQGSLEHVMPHLMSVHKREDIVFLATDIKLPGAVDWVMMQSSFGHHFILQGKQ
ncbi:hypothetical protein O3P69_017698 [Scylla paramamosain]|uniref:E3 ubiquitin-protein ligase n=1 Tax=Scylla paramamosain TaxID=85552 RepID=A0AAW0TYG0_SCYPA